MKQIIFLIVLLLSVSCQRNEILPKATSAANEIYSKYAEHKNLTVAIIGDYQGYNAVMLQAQSKDEWLKLCEEFGVKKHININDTNTTSINSLTVVSNISTNNSNEGIKQMMKELLECNSIELKEVSIDTIFATKCYKHYDHGILVDSFTTIDSEPPIPNSDLLLTSYKHDNTGYIVCDDSNKLTIWLFFYSTHAEKKQILNHITLINTQK